MIKAVVDTNVILAANSQHEGLSDECVVECVSRLNDIMNSGIIIIDDRFEILKEYQKKTSPHTGSRPGDVFLKWVLNINRDSRHCKQVPITPRCENKYAEFPCDELQEEFDSSDRKFIAVAHASNESPTVLQASDCKWLKWNERLNVEGVSVDFICRDDICNFYQAKFPGEDIPNF